VSDHTYQVNDRVIMRRPAVPTDARQGARGTVTQGGGDTLLIAWDAPAGVHAFVFADQIAPASDLSTPRDPDAPLDALTESAIVLALDTVLTAQPHDAAGVQALRDLIRGDRARQAAVPVPRSDADTAPLEDPGPELEPYRRGVRVVMVSPSEDFDDAPIGEQGTVRKVALPWNARPYLLVDWDELPGAQDLVWPEQIALA